MGVLIDTCIWMDVERGKLPPASIVTVTGDQPVYLSPVTIADRETEKAMRAVLHDRCPDHGIFGEEHGGQHLDARFVWVLDPIDGTKSFITGFPLFCSLVALLDGGRPIVGIVDVPAIGERYTAAVGAGASFDGEPIRTSGCEQLDDAVVYLAGHEPTDAELDRRFRAFRDVGRLQRYGYDAFVYALLAAGHVDVIDRKSVV